MHKNVKEREREREGGREGEREREKATFIFPSHAHFYMVFRGYLFTNEKMAWPILRKQDIKRNLAIGKVCLSLCLQNVPSGFFLSLGIAFKGRGLSNLRFNGADFYPRTKNTSQVWFKEYIRNTREEERK